MPCVNVQITRGAALARKVELVRDITASLARVPGQWPEHRHIVIQEVAEEDWGFAGHLTDDWRRRQAEGGSV